MQLCRMLRLLPGLFAACLLVTPAGGQEPRDEERANYIRSHYAKFEHYIPMRDGVRLFTVVYTPTDLRSEKYPILLFRTPYSVGPYGADLYKDRLGPHAEFEREGFIFVFQDVRGKYMSEGTFINMRPHLAKKTGKDQVDESTDTYDTIQWLLKNLENHNGKVGQWGISYPGFYSAAGMIDSHPALKAVSPQAPIADWFWDDMHHHGALILPLTFNFFAEFGQARPEPTTERAKRFEHGTPDGYQFFLDLGPLKNVNERYFKGEIEFWNEIIEHPNYDEFWQSRNLLPHLKNIKAAVMVVGGWFDTEDLYGPLKIYREVEKNNPGISNMLVMGPWVHGGWVRTDGKSLGPVDFGFETSQWFKDQVDLEFFKYHLKGEGTLTLPEALIFETGANRWRSFDAWPPKSAQRKKLYFREQGGLSWEGPQSAEEVADSYVSDPNKPVPYTMEVTTRWARKYMTEDQRFAARRPDVLVYQTEVLEEDLTLAGPILADLFVSTSGTDSDWVVKLVDVYPNKLPKADEDEEEKKSPWDDEVDLGGYQMLVRADVLRGRFRQSYEHPEPFVSGQVTPLRFELQDVLHTFKRGHRIMIQVQSTWFPFVDRNPQKFVPNIFHAEAEDFITVTNSVYRSSAHASGVEVGILP